MSSCSVFVFLSLFEFAVVNNYMGPVATKVMKGYSDEDIRSDLDGFKVRIREQIQSYLLTTPSKDGLVNIELRPLVRLLFRFIIKPLYFQGVFPDEEVRASISVPQYDTFCHGRETALFIDRFSRFFFPFSFFILNIVYWSTFL